MRKTGLLLLATLVTAMALAAVAPAAPAKTKKKGLPDACLIVTKADVTAAFAKLDPVLQPTTVNDPARSKPTNQGGFGPHACETALILPNSVSANVLVEALALDKRIGCPPKGQPGKSVKVSGTKVLLEPLPSNPAVTRDVQFADKGACVSIEIFVSGGPNHVPPSGFTDLAAAVLAKK